MEDRDKLLARDRRVRGEQPLTHAVHDAGFSRPRNRVLCPVILRIFEIDRFHSLRFFAHAPENCNQLRTGRGALRLEKTVSHAVHKPVVQTVSDALIRPVVRIRHVKKTIDRIRHPGNQIIIHGLERIVSVDIVFHVLQLRFGSRIVNIPDTAVFKAASSNERNRGNNDAFQSGTVPEQPRLQL